ncbi:pilus assembly protein TadG-related protein [Streptomyces sp. RKAG290]|nr:pilus assembly protein TadG-related protein [Streptomyces sp. RKAG290]
MVAGLLFLAFAFFAVGQASAKRNGAQGAADAAALAAAQEARDELSVPFLAALRTPNGLDDFLRFHQYGWDGCDKAAKLAYDNGAHLDGDPLVPSGCYWRSGYLQDRVTARVKTREPVGKSVIPATETKYATATATAVIEFRCTFKPAPESPDPDPGQGDGNGDGEGDSEETPGPFEFRCDGQPIKIDLGDPDPLAGLTQLLFAVHLIDD